MALSAFGAMSDCMSPRDQIAKLRFTKRTWIYDLEKKVRTGDIVLFNSKHSTSNITKFFTKASTHRLPPALIPMIASDACLQR